MGEGKTLDEYLMDALPFIPVLILAIYMFYGISTGEPAQNPRHNTTVEDIRELKDISVAIESHPRNPINESENLEHRTFHVIEQDESCKDVYDNTSEGWKTNDIYKASFSTRDTGFTMENVNQGEIFKLCSLRRETGTFYRSNGFKIVNEKGEPELQHEFSASREPVFVRMSEYDWDDGRVVQLPELEIEFTNIAEVEQDDGSLPFI